MTPRHEFRYFIREDLARRIRDFVCEYLELDEYGVGQPNYSYPVHTVYLDSDDWKIYWRTVRGDQERLKLRLRYYNSQPDAPVFCEIKRQKAEVISKQRGAVRREALEAVLAGFPPERNQLCSPAPAHAFAAERFVELVTEFRARPKLHVTCQREAYVPHDDATARVTLDRDLCVGEVGPDLLAMEVERPLVRVRDGLILELRFTDRFPNWYRDLVRTFNLSHPFLWKHSQQHISLPGLRLTPDDVIYNIVL